MTESVLTHSSEEAAAAAKAGEQSGAANKEAAGSAEKAVAKTATPEKYELKAPEGFDAARLPDVEKFAREQGLTAAAAQKLLDREAANAAAAGKAFQESSKAQLADASKKWVEAIKADKEIGGDSFNGSIEGARRALEKFGSPELRKALDETGLGNHPELVRAFAKIGKAMAEDKFHSGSQGGGKQAPRDAATLLYGK